MTYTSISEKGGRPVNEDSVGQYVGKEASLFIVADGLGGHGAGDIASQYVVGQYLYHFQDNDLMEPAEYMTSTFASIQSGLRALQLEQHKDMKSTAAAVILTDDILTIGHIGDSRVYVFGKRKLLYRTLDHSVPQMLVNAGELKEKSIRHHPDRSRILRALGEESDTVACTILTMPVTEEVQGILLCSDGFWEHILERQMLWSMRKNISSETWMEDMVKIVCRNGQKERMDNYSAIAVRL